MTEADLPNNQDQAELQDNQPTLPPSMADSVGGNLAGSILDASSAHATDAPIETSSQNSPEVAINIEEEWLTCAGIAKVLGVSNAKAKRFVESKISEHPGWERISGAGTRESPVTTRYHPGLTALLRSEIEIVPKAPEGWVTNGALAKVLGVNETTVKRVVESFLDEYPERVRDFRSSTGNTRAYYSPELQAAVQQKLDVEDVEDGWSTISELRENLGVDHGTVKKIVEPFKNTNPSWFKEAKLPRGIIAQTLSPELIQHVRKEIEARTPPPEGWTTQTGLAKDLAADWGTVVKYADKYREEHPEWFAIHTRQGHASTEHISPALVSLIKQELTQPEQRPDGWFNRTQLVDVIGRPKQTIAKTAEAYREEHPEWFHTYGRGRKTAEYYSPELVEALAAEFAARQAIPNGWMSSPMLQESTGRSENLIRKLVETYREEHPEWFKQFDGVRRHKVEYFHPRIVAEIQQNVAQRSEPDKELSEREILQGELQGLLSNLEEGTNLDAQEFRSLVGLFGADLAIDILYQQHPEYGKLPIPYVKSMLADYLGDFLSIRGQFSLAALEKGAPLLAHGVFKEAFMEIVKIDCLKLLNHLSRTAPDELNVQAITEHMAHIREETASLASIDLEEALNEVEAYYQLLFDNIHKPDRFIDRLQEGRFFPDINQRINVQEVAFKERVLIADEMGTGKSASAIMAKEIIGARQALVVVPSNVLDTWTDYLSDRVSSTGERTGYFKAGQAPSVLVVDSLQTLRDASSLDYEYILISQERLSGTYVEALGKFNYDMLIVDEMHKLKNISSGKRTESLIALSERIQDESNYLVLLSGTPVPNKISDIAITLKLLYPDKFADMDDRTLTSQILNGDLLNLRSLLVPRMQMKSLAETVEMPEREEIIHTFPLSKDEREVYEILIDEDELTATEKLAILRQCILNPRFVDATPDLMGSKIKTVGEDLQQTFEEKDRVVMFVNNYVEGVIRGSINIRDELVVPRDVEVLTIDGSVDKRQRLLIQERLNQGDGKVLVLVSGQTADVGVDFSGAQEVYIYNEPWTMYDKQQQIARVYRPGLKTSLKIRTYIATDTIEEGIHGYIESKYKAVEKLLRGVPISEIETEMLRANEKASGTDAEVNAELAEYYFSSWDKMMKIYGHVKEIGEKDFVEFLSEYDQVYAESYANVVGSRSYQANVSRMAASLIHSLAENDSKRADQVVVLDIASGPEMLKKHAPSHIASRIVSVDINAKHFSPNGTGKRVVGSFVNLPIADKSVDYVNLSLGLHYTSFSPSKKNYERLKVLQEVNRVLPVGGQGIISMIYSMDLPEDQDFQNTMSKLGFMVVSSHTGEVASGKNFRTQLITLKKIKDCETDTHVLANDLGAQGLQSLKMKKTKISLRNARGILTSFPINETAINIVLNDNDRGVLEEEGTVSREMESLKQQYGGIERIPKEAIYRSGLSRIFNGKRYVLFKRLQSDASAVVIK